MGPSVLEVREVTQHLGSRLILDRVSLSVHPGEVVGLLGPNGAGKSTLFRVVMGLCSPESGAVLLHGRDVSREPIHRRARLGLGYLGQEPSAFLGLTVEQNLRAVLELRRLHGEQSEELLLALGLGGLRTQRAHTLSGGERRRLEVARTLVQRCSVILLDEPFKGLDPQGALAVRAAIAQRAADGAAILITDHPPQQALAICGRAYFLDGGVIAASGTAEELAFRSLAQRLFPGWPSCSVEGDGPSRPVHGPA